MPNWDYKTEVLTSIVGRDKLRIGDLEDAIKKAGGEGWELATLTLDADLRDSRDGHLMIYKRPRA